MTTRYRLRYNGKAYVFDENPLDDVDVTKVQTLNLKTWKDQEVTILVSPEIPMQVEAFDSTPSRMKTL